MKYILISGGFVALLFLVFVYGAFTHNLADRTWEHYSPLHTESEARNTHAGTYTNQLYGFSLAMADEWHIHENLAPISRSAPNNDPASQPLATFTVENDHTAGLVRITVYTNDVRGSITDWREARRSMRRGLKEATCDNEQTSGCSSSAEQGTTETSTTSDKTTSYSETTFDSDSATTCTQFASTAYIYALCYDSDNLNDGFFEQNLPAYETIVASFKLVA